jgi:uncharacterized membrane protein
MGALGFTLPEGFNEWSFTTLTPWSTPVLLGCAALLVAAFAVVWKSTRKAPASVRVPISVLRGLGLLLAMALLLEPGVQMQQVSSTPGRVALVLDRSASMALPTGDPSGETRLERARVFLNSALPQLPEGVTPEVYTFAETASLTAPEDVAALTATGTRTHMMAALDQALAVKPGRPLVGMLVLGDGADNVDLLRDVLPGQVRQRLSSAGIPIHTVTLGAEQGLKDLQVADVDADDFAFVRNPLTVDAHVVARGLGDISVPVTLRRDGRVVGVQQAALVDGVSQRVSFTFEPREVGEAVYTVDVPVQAGEALADNNRRAFTLKVIRDRIRVLQVAGRPSWDERFLRQLLKENPSVDLISFFILRTPQDASDVRPEELSLIPFPTRELFTEELHTFDVVIFQNFNFAPYDMGGYLPNVRQFVMDGGGFAMVGGDLSFSEAGYEQTVLADVLPVQLPPGRGHYVEEPFTAQVTEAGKRHPILQFAQPGVSAFLQARPPFEGFNPVLGLHQGAEALLTHPSPRSGPAGQPVLAVREVGRGRTLSLQTDSLWFWALPDAGAGGRGSAHRELWANAIRWLIGDPALSRVRVEASASAFDPNEPVALTVRAFDPSYGPLAGAQVQLTVDALDGANGSERRTLHSQTLQTGADGEAVVRIPPPGPCAYRARVTARAGGTALGSDEDAFLVREADRERAEGAPRPALMAALSEATQGSVIRSASEVAGLRWALPEGKRVHQRKTQALWDQSAVGVLFALLWAAEWVLRRRAGYA